MSATVGMGQWRSSLRGERTPCRGCYPGFVSGRGWPRLLECRCHGRPPATCSRPSRCATSGLAENPTHGTLVGDQFSPEGIFRPEAGRPGLLEAVSGSEVGLRPSMFSRKPLFGWASSGLAENPTHGTLVRGQSPPASPFSASRGTARRCRSPSSRFCVENGSSSQHVFTEATLRLRS